MTLVRQTNYLWEVVYVIIAERLKLHMVVKLVHMASLSAILVPAVMLIFPYVPIFYDIYSKLKYHEVFVAIGN